MQRMSGLPGCVNWKNARTGAGIPVTALCRMERGPPVRSRRISDPATSSMRSVVRPEVGRRWTGGPRSVPQHSVAENFGDLADHFIGALAKMVLHAEEDLDGEVVVEDARGQHDRGGGRQAVLQFVAQLLLHPV